MLIILLWQKILSQILYLLNDFARNVVIVGVDNSSSSHTDNQKNNFLVLGEGPTVSALSGTVSAEK